MESKVSSTDQIHDKIEIVSILEAEEGINQELVFQTFQKVKLIHDWFNAFLEKNSE